MAQVILQGEQYRLTVEGRLATGRPGRLTERPTWVVEPPILSLEVAPDGLSCVVAPVAQGDCTVTVRCLDLSASYAMSVLAGQATNLVVRGERVE